MNKKVIIFFICITACIGYFLEPGHQGNHLSLQALVAMAEDDPEDDYPPPDWPPPGSPIPPPDTIPSLGSANYIPGNW